MNKRLPALLAVVVIVVGACSPAASQAPAATGGASQPAATTAAAPATITVWARNYTLDEGRIQPWAPGPKAAFEAAHPGATVNLAEGVTSDAQFKRIELSQAGAAADKPDIFQLDNIWLGQFV